MICNASLKPPDGHRVLRYSFPLVIRMILCMAVAIGWVHSAMTQTQAPQSGDQSQSAAELGKQAANPLSAGWLMQIQQNNQWVGTPPKEGDRYQSDLVFQPLVNFKLTDDWTLFTRPVVTFFRSTPFVDASGREDRVTAFGDTAIAFAVAPHPFVNGHLIIAGGPTFIFPTASDHRLGQQAWQLGPDLGIVWQGKHFLAYGFPQQWFKIGGDGATTNQMSTILDYTYFFKSGWSIGSQPTFFVNWRAPSGEKVTFPVGLQVGKLCKCGHIPTLIQLQGEYYPVRQSTDPRWNVQLQVTPTIAPLIKRAIF
jgi:hypothetical protein